MIVVSLRYITDSLKNTVILSITIKQSRIAVRNTGARGTLSAGASRESRGRHGERQGDCQEDEGTVESGGNVRGCGTSEFV